jgi:hypothetical protein
MWYHFIIVCRGVSCIIRISLVRRSILILIDRCSRVIAVDGSGLLTLIVHILADRTNERCIQVVVEGLRVNDVPE